MSSDTVVYPYRRYSFLRMVEQNVPIIFWKPKQVLKTGFKVISPVPCSMFLVNGTDMIIVARHDFVAMLFSESSTDTRFYPSGVSYAFWKVFNSLQ